MSGAVRAARRSPGRNLLPVSITTVGALLLVIGFVTGAGASTPASEVAVLAPSADTFIAEAAPSSTHNTGLLSVTGNDSAATEWSGLQFDLAGYFDTASYPQDVDVVSAQLTLTVETAPANLLTLTPRRLAAASTWSETATWTNSQAKWNSGSDGANYPIDNTTTSVTIDVTADVQGFLDGDYTNNGWAIRAQTGAETVVFHSSEAADENDRPRLTIEYDTRTSLLRPPAGLYATDIAGTFEDTYVQPGAPGAANGTLDYIRIGRSSTDRMDTLIRFDFGADNPPIDQATILSARLVLPVKVPGVDRTLHAARICRPAGLSLDGAISAATYNSVPYSALQSVQASPPLDYTNGMAELTFDVTGIVQAWADGEANLGFHVYQQSPIPAVADWIDLYSFNESLNTNRPRLEFEYVPDGGNSNPTATPSCEEATPTPTNTNTPTHTPTGTPGTPTATPTGTQTDTPTPPATNTPTNTPTGTPGITTSAELTLDSPDEDAMVPRSRLTFTATSGSLAPAEVSFVIQRDADDMYWDAEAAAWTADEFENAATGSGSEWSYAVTGDARRLFVDTELTVEIRASKGSQEYRSAESASVTVR